MADLTVMKPVIVKIDEDGFLVDPSLWDEHVRDALAVHHNLVLNQGRLDVIDSIREQQLESNCESYWDEYCLKVNDTDKSILAFKMFVNQFDTACAIAGLPHPKRQKKLRDDSMFDSLGWLICPDDWTISIARIIAAEKEQQIENGLSIEQWKYIGRLRNYYNKAKRVPKVENLDQITGEKVLHVYRLFPAGPIEGLYKIAGMPRPLNIM